MSNKKIRVTLVILVSMLVFSSCGKATNHPEPTQESTVTVAPTPEPTLAPTPTAEPTPTPTAEPTVTPTPESTPATIIDTWEMEVPAYSYGYYYDLLNDCQQVMYSYIISHLEVISKDYVGFLEITKDEAIEVIQALINDSIYQCKTMASYEVNEILFVKLCMDSVVTDEQSMQVEKEASKILYECSAETTEETIIKIYDWCTSNIEYDDEAEHSRDLYGALVEHKCVCVGYAKAFAYLCDKMGIKVICVSNDTHMWNYMCLNNKWYAVDVTNGYTGTSQYLLKGKEILEEEPYILTQNFILPELAEESFYPDQQEADKFKEHLERNVSACQKRMQKIKKYRQEEAYNDQYETMYDLCWQVLSLSTELLEKLENSFYDSYLNTKECTEKRQKINELVIKMNEMDW